MPDDILGGEPGEVHVVQTLQDVLDLAQPALGSARQVDLGDVTGDDDLGVEAEAGEEHLHLLGAGVLRLVEDDERVVERATTHVSERRDLDRARRHQPRDRVGVEHVVQGIVERAQIRVDLVEQGARQETEPLPASTAGRVRMIRLTCLDWSAWTALAIAR